MSIFQFLSGSGQAREAQGMPRRYLLIRGCATRAARRVWRVLLLTFFTILVIAVILGFLLLYLFADVGPHL